MLRPEKIHEEYCFDEALEVPDSSIDINRRGSLGCCRPISGCRSCVLCQREIDCYRVCAAWDLSLQLGAKNVGRRLEHLQCQPMC